MSAALLGLVAWFNVRTCPQGWTPYVPLQGRIAVAVSSAAAANVSVGGALKDAEDPLHMHTLGGSIYVGYQDVLCTSSSSPDCSCFDCQSLLHSWTYYYVQTTQVARTGLPLLQLLPCEYTDSSIALSVPTGITTYFAAHVNSCPAGWIAYVPASGPGSVPGPRTLMPSNVTVPVPSVGQPITAGTNLSHVHNWGGTIRYTQFVEVDCDNGGSNNDPAVYGPQTWNIGTTTITADAGLPYLTMLACTYMLEGPAIGNPFGMLAFSAADGQCPTAWVPQHAYDGNFIVGAAEHGTIGQPYGSGGPVLPGVSSYQNQHTHLVPDTEIPPVRACLIPEASGAKDFPQNAPLLGQAAVSPLAASVGVPPYTQHTMCLQNIPPTPSATATATSSATATATATATSSASATATATPTASQTRTASATASASATATTSGSASPTSSVTPSVSVSPSSLPCPGHGVCSFHGSCVVVGPPNREAVCRCDAGWMGSDCSTPVPAVNVPALAGGLTASAVVVAAAGLWWWRHRRLPWLPTTDTATGHYTAMPEPSAPFLSMNGNGVGSYDAATANINYGATGENGGAAAGHYSPAANRKPGTR